MPVIFVGGRFVEAEHALVSLLDRGYLLGDGVFATMRGYRGACFRPAAHLTQLERGAALLDIPLPMTPAAIADIADVAAARTGAEHAYIRVTLTRGPYLVDPTDDPSLAAPTLSVIAREMIVPSEEDYARGVDAVTVAPRRVPPACLDGTVKTTSYAMQTIAHREALRRGAAEGIQLAVDGSLACATMANLFLIVGNTLATPAIESGCRAGITRAAILELAPRVGMTVREARLDPSELSRSDEVFLTSTRVECLPIATIDGIAIGRRPFARTAALRAALQELVQSESEIVPRQNLERRSCSTAQTPSDREAPVLPSRDGLV